MFCQIIVSATSKREAEKISGVLIKKKLIAGSLIIKGFSRYWWKGKIVKKEYYNIQAFSSMRNKLKIIAEVEKIHSDKCPIIVFIKIDGNKKFLDWIKKSIR